MSTNTNQNSDKMSFKIKKQLEPQLSKISEMSFDHDHDTRLRIHQENDIILDHLVSISSTESDENHNKGISSSDTIININNLYRKRGFSLCDPVNPNLITIDERERKKLSLPTLNVPQILVRRGSRTSLSSTGSEKFDSLAPNYKDLFYNLDGVDGRPDGKIHKKSLQNILTTLQTPSDLSLDLRTSNRSLEFTRQISQVDTDKDGYICHDEYADLILQMEEMDDPDQKEKNAEMLDNLEKGAYAEVFRTCPPPLFMITISLLQVGIFIYYASLHHQSSSWTGNAPLCSSLIYNPHLRRQVWRYLTYSLVHSGISHILLNVSMQLVVGLVLEMSHGSLRISLLYFIGVISGSLTSSCTEPEVHLAGASSGVYALIAAHLSNLILNWKEDVLIIRQDNTGIRAINGGLIRLLKLTALVAFVVVDVIIGLYNNYYAGHTSTTSYGAHIAGASIGLLAGILILNNRKVETWEQWLKLGCYMLLGIFFLATLLWNILGDQVYSIFFQKNFFPHYQSSDDCPFMNEGQTNK